MFKVAEKLMYIALCECDYVPERSFPSIYLGPSQLLVDHQVSYVVSTSFFMLAIYAYYKSEEVRHRDVIN